MLLTSSVGNSEAFGVESVCLRRGDLISVIIAQDLASLSNFSQTRGIVVVLVIKAFLSVISLFSLGLAVKGVESIDLQAFSIKLAGHTLARRGGLRSQYLP